MKLRSTVSGVIALLLVVFVALPAQAAGEAGQVSYIKGGVWLARGGKRIEIKPDMAIYSGDVVVTEASGRVRLAMVDKSVIYVGGHSRMTIKNYKVDKDNMVSAKLNLLWGKARFLVSRLAGDRAKYGVHTSSAVMGVRGTQFTTSIPRPVNMPKHAGPVLPPGWKPAPQPTEVMLFDGAIVATNIKGVKFAIKPGTFARFDPAGYVVKRPIRPSDIRNIGLPVLTPVGAGEHNKARAPEAGPPPAGAPEAGTSPAGAASESGPQAGGPFMKGPEGQPRSAAPGMMIGPGGKSAPMMQMEIIGPDGKPVPMVPGPNGIPVPVGPDGRPIPMKMGPGGLMEPVPIGPDGQPMPMPDALPATTTGPAGKPPAGAPGMMTRPDSKPMPAAPGMMLAPGSKPMSGAPGMIMGPGGKPPAGAAAPARLVAPVAPPIVAPPPVIAPKVRPPIIRKPRITRFRRPIVKPPLL